MAYALVHLGLGALLFLGFWATGRALARAAHAPLDASRLPFASAVGLGMLAWSAGLFALAAAGALEPALLRALALGAGGAGALGLGRAALRRLRAARRRPPSAAAGSRGEPAGAGAPEPEPRAAAAASRLDLAGAAALAASLALFGLLALDPRVAWDADTYHLALPRRFLEERGLVRIPYFVYSTWPLATELLYAVALALRDHVLAHLLHFGCGALLVNGAARLARDAAGPAAGVLAGSLLLLDPSLRFELTSAYVDLAFALFALLAFAAWDPARAPAGAGLGAEPARRRARLVLAGLFLGGAAATKLPGFVVALVFGALEAGDALARRRPLRRALGDLACLLAPALALGAPWYLRSALLTGDPLHPALYGLFHGGGAEWSAELAARTAEHHRGYGMGRAPWDLLLLPLRATAPSNPEAVARFGGTLHPLWALLAPLVAWGAWVDRGARRLAAPGLLYLVAWAFLSQTVRLLLPAQPFFCAAAAVAAVHAARAAAPRVPRLASGLAAALAAATLVELAAGSAPRLRELHALAARGEEAVLASAVPAHCRFLNERLAQGARVLMLNENRSFHCRRAFLADSLFQASQLEAELRRLPDAASVDAWLRERGVTHVLVAERDWGIAWPAPLRAALADPARLAPVYRDPDYALYALTPSAPSPSRGARRAPP